MIDCSDDVQIPSSYTNSRRLCDLERESRLQRRSIVHQLGKIRVTKNGLKSAASGRFDWCRASHVTTITKMLALLQV